ncbi:twin-arginine translocation pathway signal protein [Streptomyces carminius]|uniref:Thiamine pyrimidine synthase n=1 Tax=Streptomyces carminius TaxID=2665496 RepID=A0A2M8MBL2_9ACTN|nr:ABC transporter substrate-binding protein [Streptomyces carminius]PJF01597.1 twin-arginine translocation pathway signal protein [Streptomyces carminius]
MPADRISRQNESAPAWSRRRLLKVAGAAGGVALGGGLLAGCGDDGGARASSSADRVRVALGWLNDIEFAGFWNADAAGYYAEENLSVEFQEGGPNAPDTTILLANGQADIGVHANMQILLQAIAKGNDFRMVGAALQTNPGGLLSLASDPVREPRDLTGARILGQVGAKPQINAIFDLAGLKKDYEFVPAGSSVDPLLEKKGKVLTCYMTSEPITLRVKHGMKPGKDFVTVTYESLGLPAYATIVYCGRKFLRQRGNVMERFMRATLRGWQDNFEDPEHAARLVVGKYGADLGLDLTEQTRGNEVQISFMENDLTRRKGLFRMDAGRLGGPMYAGLRAAGVKDLPEADEVVDNSVLDAVYRGRTRV